MELLDPCEPEGMVRPSGAGAPHLPDVGDGSEGLLKDRKTIVIVTTGGVPLGSGYDFATPYIRHILGFIGITGVTFIDAGRLMFENDKLDKARVEINTTLAGPLARAA